MITIREETFRPTSKRARRCSMPASAPSGSRRPANACAKAACRPTACRSCIERDGALVGTVRLWHVAAGPNRPALLLGPIAIDPSAARASASAAS